MSGTGTDTAAPSTALEPIQSAPPAHRTQLDYSARLGMWLAAAESNSNDPKVKGMAAALRIEYARLLDLPPHAASEIHVIKGNLSVSAKLCRALARERGVKVERVDETPESCTAVVLEIASGQELGRTTYTMEQAKRAGLVKPDSNWIKVPDRMLWARASKRALDDHAPWVTVGVLTDEDIDDAGWGRELREQVAASGATVIDADQAFEVIDEDSGAVETQPTHADEGVQPEDASATAAPEEPAGEGEQSTFEVMLPESVRAAGTDPDA